MIDLKNKISGFYKIGEIIKTQLQYSNDVFEKAYLQNHWFDYENLTISLNYWINTLSQKENIDWMVSIAQKNSRPKNIGIVCAGNIPLVGFHDVLCVLLSGNIAKIKLSHQDTVMMKFLIEGVLTIVDDWKELIQYKEKLGEVDALIATGSDNTARYLDYYFSNTPRILRKNRTSVAILSGEESNEELMKLGKDIFTYYGLGCRNVSKIYVPVDYNFDPLLNCWYEHFKNVIHHNKYLNNYEYRKAIFDMNSIKYLDNGLILLLENENFFSQVATIHYTRYSKIESCIEDIIQNQDKIQVISTNIEISKIQTINICRLGETQNPRLTDFADNIDTILFLKNLK